jgi:hypothetical protein
MERRGELIYYLIEDPLGEGETIGYSRYQLRRVFDEYGKEGGVSRILYVPEAVDGRETLRRFEEELYRRYEERSKRRMDWAWFLRFCGAATSIYAFETLCRAAYIPLAYHLSRYLFLTRELVEVVLDPVAIPFTTALGFVLGLSPLLLSLVITYRFMAGEAGKDGKIAEWLRKLLGEEVEIIKSGELTDFRRSVRGLVEEARRSLEMLNFPSLDERIKACRRLTRSLAEIQAQASYYGLEPLVDYYHRLKASFYSLSRKREVLRKDRALKRRIKELREWR